MQVLRMAEQGCCSRLVALAGLILLTSSARISAQRSASADDQLYELQEHMACLESSLDQLVHTLGSKTKPKDCRDVYHQGGEVDGVYLIWPDEQDSTHPIRVLCHFDTEGQWIVLQRRIDGQVDFARPWAAYREGFGRMAYNSEFWLGLESLHRLTRQQQYTLRIDLVGWQNQRVHAEYSIFYIADEHAKYAIFYDGYSGTAGDAMGEVHRNMKFTTSDQDNDTDQNNNCANYHGPWWLKDCDSANLNGRFGEGEGNRGIE